MQEGSILSCNKDKPSDAQQFENSSSLSTSIATEKHSFIDINLRLINLTYTN